jgi:hypothetical protein
VLILLRSFGTLEWHDNLATYLFKSQTLANKYAMERKQNRIPMQIAPGKKINLSPGEHSELIRAIVEEFGPRFYGKIFKRNRMGNRSVGGGCAIASYSF